VSVRWPTLRRDETARQALLHRIFSEFEEMPGMFLTVAQAARLFDLPLDACARMLADLADGGLLHQAVNGRYRLQAGPVDRKAR
jgi:DNA-binding IclR family transcriptional regulator